MGRPLASTKSAKKGHSSALATSSLPSSSASLKRFAELIPLDIDIEKARQITLKGKQLASLPPNLGVLLREVRRVDLSENNLRDVAPLAVLHHLTSVNLSKNPQLSSIAPLAPLRLTVCVVAHCSLRSLTGLEGSAPTLKSLVANDNELVLQSPTGCAVANAKTDDVAVAVQNYEALGALTACETVVLSRNPQLCALYATKETDEEAKEEEKDNNNNNNDSGGDGGHDKRKRKGSSNEAPHREADWAHPLSVLEKMPHLKKLSLSECGLVSLPSHWFLPMVTELRLSHNSLQSLLPEGVIFRSLKILDVSHNTLTHLSTLRRCRFVRQLSIVGNPFLKDDDAAPPTEGEETPTSLRVPPRVVRYLTRVMPYLEVVDSKPLSSLQSSDAVEESHHSEDITAGSKAAKDATLKQQEDQPAEDKDVVVEPPVSVVETVRAPIVRRERTNMLTQRKRELAADGAAVAQLMMRRKTEGASW
ncbi:putative leucine-rich repeat protein (LRRP) [Trypanosoma grayi]|uniref:putative leucine-rich repeat protein (LRRP) n=1 Tax=Trypanosoma grayi TaxID=71804 RepID=UPI0004F45E99|nr:putative leucine-rich repeat protein (LRRP) [Trypanosoma grayi]KEG15409.1 putative leucine-rich repeat protein (LRRP) [Trypanosoma grayi]